MAYKINGKFVSKETWEAYQQEQDKAVQTDNQQEGNTMLALEEKEEMLESEKPFNFAGVGYTSALHVVPTADNAENNDGQEGQTVDDQVEDAAHLLDDESPEFKALMEDVDELIKQGDEEMPIPNVTPNNVTYETITIRDFVQLAETLNDALAYQRPIVWKQEDRDYLLDSILGGYDINVVSLHGKNVVDGKQRKNTLQGFYSGLYSPLGIEGEFEDINGKSIASWDKDYQAAFLDHPITIRRYPESWDEDRVVEQFMRTNKGGRPLTTAQIYKNQTREIVTALNTSIKNPIWKLQKTNTKKQTVSIYGNMSLHNLFFSLLHFLHAEKHDFKESAMYKWLIPWGKTAGSIIFDNVNMRVKTLENIYKIMVSAADGDERARNYYCKKVHLLPILAAIDDRTDADNAAMRLLSFWQQRNDKEGKNKPEVKEYATLCSGGTNDTASINKRVAFMRELIHK
jgi:hypothetical protein